MTIFFSFFKNIIGEIAVIFLLIFSINNYLGNVNETIKADGVGYYDYLPSIFIHHDISRKDKPYVDSLHFYNRIDKIGAYTGYKTYKLDKYPCGTALLISPFFLCTYQTALIWDIKCTGYEYPFQRAVFYAAVFYFFLALLFFRKLLELFHIRKINILFLQLLMALATSVSNYIYYDSSFSHIYSLFAVSAFLYFAKSYFKTENTTHFIWVCLCLALIFLLRNINIIIILFIPFLADSSTNLKEKTIFIFKNPVKLSLSLLGMSAIIALQCILWHLQTGEFIVYSYTNEGFNFSAPMFTDILFSYQKGLFIYTPILFIGLFGLVRLIYKRHYYLVSTWLLFLQYLRMFYLLGGVGSMVVVLE
jgi:hypothetical protein